MKPSPFAAVVEAFNTDDHVHRVETLRTCLAEDAEVSHIHGVSVGPVAFSEVIGQIRDVLPGCTATLGREARSLDRWVAQMWTLHTADGAVFASGEYVARRSIDGAFSHLASIPDAHE